MMKRLSHAGPPFSVEPLETIQVVVATVGPVSTLLTVAFATTGALAPRT